MQKPIIKGKKKNPNEWGLDRENPDPMKVEENKMRREKLARGGPKSRINWSFSDLPDDRWPF